MQCRLGIEAYKLLCNDSYQNENNEMVIQNTQMSDSDFGKWLSNVYSCNQESVRNLSTNSKVRLQEEEDDDLVSQLAVFSKLDLGDPTHKSFEYPSNSKISEPKKKSAYAVHQEQKEINKKKDWFV